MPPDSNFVLPTYVNVGSKYDVFILFQIEFHPGVPWKGLQNIDPENDPDVTPGSVPTGPTINTTIQDVNRYLLKSGGSIAVLCSAAFIVSFSFPLLSVIEPASLKVTSLCAGLP